MFDSVTGYTAQGVDLNLREVPGAIFGQGWNRESSYFTGLGAGKTVGTLGGSIGRLRSTFIENVQHGYELVLVQHRGLQSNAELGAAYMLRSPNLEIAQLRINVAGGVGPVACLRHAQSTKTARRTTRRGAIARRCCCCWKRSGAWPRCRTGRS